MSITAAIGSPEPSTASGTASSEFGGGGLAGLGREHLGRHDAVVDEVERAWRTPRALLPAVSSSKRAAPAERVGDAVLGGGERDGLGAADLLTGRELQGDPAIGRGAVTQRFPPASR